MYQNDPMKVLTGEVRLSYCSLTTPRAAKQGGEPKYSVTLLIPKTDNATKADIDAAINAAAQEALTKVWNGARPPVVKVPIHDGDGVRPSGVPFGDECKGHWVLTASTKNKPQVVGIDNINCELAPSDIYSGMYGRVTVRFFGYSNSGNKGIGCGLGNVLKTRDGEPLSGQARHSGGLRCPCQHPALEQRQWHQPHHRTAHVRRPTHAPSQHRPGNLLQRAAGKGRGPEVHQEP